MYALVIDGAIVQTASKPTELRNLDDGTRPLYWDGITDAELAACGWFPVVDTPPAYDTATEVLERGDVVLVDGVPTRDYTVRPQTVDELAAEADTADRQAKGVNVGQAVTWLRNQSDIAESTTATSGNAVAVLNGVLDNLAIFYDGFADLLEHLRLDQLGEA